MKIPIEFIKFEDKTDYLNDIHNYNTYMPNLNLAYKYISESLTISNLQSSINYLNNHLDKLDLQNSSKTLSNDTVSKDINLNIDKKFQNILDLNFLQNSIVSLYSINKYIKDCISELSLKIDISDKKIKNYEEETDYEIGIIQAIEKTLAVDKSKELEDFVDLDVQKIIFINERTIELIEYNFPDISSVYQEMSETEKNIILTFNLILCRFKSASDIYKSLNTKFTSLKKSIDNKFLALLNASYVRSGEFINVYVTPERKIKISAFSPPLPHCKDYDPLWMPQEVATLLPNNNCPTQPENSPLTTAK